MIRAALALMSIALAVSGFFWVAGDGRWTRGWVAILFMLSTQGASQWIVWRRNPELIRRRSRIGAGTKHWDRWWLSGFALVYVAVWVVAALDHRFGWSGMPNWLFALGVPPFLLFVVGLAWSMTTNPHFEKTVRIQTDRNHRVIDTGPYSFVRHPGYAFLVFGFFPATPLLLGSWWAFVPAVASALWLVLRTALEDRTLREELAGYEAYSRRVRYRLCPGLW